MTEAFATKEAEDRWGCGDQLKDEDPYGIRPVALNASEAGLHLVSTVGGGRRLVPHPADEAGALLHCLYAQFGLEAEGDPVIRSLGTDLLCQGTLILPRNARWAEAVETALLGPWSKSLWSTDGFLPVTAVSTLRTEARAVHRQLGPVWRRGTRHGRVLSLDAALGDGLSLYDLVVSEVDYLAHTAGGVFEDDRLNRVLRGLTPVERAVVFAYAEGEGTTWSEAAAHAAATDPDAFGERVRRKTRRLAAEQHRRAELARTAP